MRAVKGRDTTPELAVRSMLHRLGRRFSLHRADLPGRPDIVMPARGCVVFVHGCFWHGHGCARGRRKPVANAAYWTRKIDGTIRRDRRTLRALREAGWNAVVVWECELRNSPKLAQRLARATRTFRHM